MQNSKCGGCKLELGIVLLAVVSLRCVNGQCDVLAKGGYIQKNLQITVDQSPCEVKKTAIIGKGYTLTVQEGSELHFGPGVMLAVNGTLLAKGTPSRRIMMTKIPKSTDAPPAWPDDIRLVDDSSVMFGRLEVKYRQKWRGICANFQNWTQADVNVSCRQLGFETGNFSFVSWANNDTSFMLYHQPRCTGIERNILDCPGSPGIKIGSRICRQQMTVSLQCYGLSPSSPARDYWWGLEFYNASITISIDDIIAINESSSILQNVDISYAGVSPNFDPVPAVRASPTIPALVNVTISHMALDGTNFTEALSPTIVFNSEIKNCRGHGLGVETHLGRVEVKNSDIHDNFGNGVKAKFVDGHFIIVDELLTFCKMANIGKQTFPQLISGIPSFSTHCGRRFEGKSGQRLTLNVLEMEIERGVRGSLEVFDGRDENSARLATYMITNGTLPMGVTSTFYFMFIRFTWNIPPGFTCTILRDCISFTILVDTAIDSKPEFYMNSSSVRNNLQHGLFLENMRNYIVVNASTVTYNGYGAGIRIFSGAGDVLVNASVVNFNQNNGVNITYNGGWRIFNQSSFSYNYGNGINITTNETRGLDNRTTRYTRHQRTEVSRSQFKFNDGHGFRIGNFCQSALTVVNDSMFIGNLRAAVEFESCYKLVPEANVSNFTVGYSLFDGNKHHAIRITPLLNAVGRITNNTFTNHSRYVILLNNGYSLVDDQFYIGTKVGYEIIGNSFYNNRGLYLANLRLTEGSQRQKMDIRYNVFRSNEIVGSSPTLNERTRAYAPLIISSSNINLERNHLENPASQYEIATHLFDLSATISVLRNWWGTTSYEAIVQRIFDQFNRYDLARIVYHPALNDAWLYTPTTTDRNPPYEIPFARGDRLGGRLGSEFHTTPGMTYLVDRDMSVLSLGLLYVEPGTTLEFGNSLGMLVEGYIDFRGEPDRPVIIHLANESTWINHTLIRLVDGPNLLEGRLEVRPSELHDWGTICNDSWTLQDASIACQMMGLVVNLDEWRVFDNTAGTDDQPIWRSNVRCNKYDVDLMECDADDENDHSCSHAFDVYVKCREPTWAGIRFLARADPSRMRYVNISGAGLSDPAAVIYSAALRIDYNVHTLEHITVENNMADGIVIMHNDVYAGARLVSSVVRNNVGNGLTVRSSFFEMFDCRLEDNGRAGFEYSPMYTAADALQIRAGIRDAIMFDQSMKVKLNVENRRWVVTPRRYEGEQTTYDLEVEVDPQYKVVVDVIDFNPLTQIEQVTVFDSRQSAIRDGTLSWKIDEDLVDFPVVSQLTFMTIRWTISGIATGRLAFVLRSKPWNWRWPFATLTLRNSTVSGNSHGVVTRHYNQPTNEWLDIFSRYRWENVRLYGLHLVGNRYEAVHALSITRYNYLYLPTFEELQKALKIAEITYTVESCLFEENGGGILAEHNHVEFSNNVWIWQVSSNRFERNFGGGYMIELPRVNLMYSELYNHSVNINDTSFYANENFAFRVDGFYCNSTITRNRFERNHCRVGCVTFAGTEKDLELVDNEFVENYGLYIVEFNMNSHTPFTQWVESRVEFNIIKRNRRPENMGRSTATSQPTTYALGIRGLQNVTVNRNLIVNPEMDFELLGGQSSSLLENYLDVTANWWGTTDQAVIIDRIFDFDDWNSFAIAEYCPFLSSDTFRAQLPPCNKRQQILDMSRPFGGRITENLKLTRRDKPYVIKSDLTVMSGVSMIIEAGAEIQLYPSVGILVLGSLVINGNPTNRVKFGPVHRSDLLLNRGRRATTTAVRSVDKIHHPDIDARMGYQVKFVGGPNDDEGFITIYNQTERRWAIICDSHFNERTAEVACRNAGKESSNVIVRRSRYYDMFVLGYQKMHEQVMEWFWRETLICDGRESSLDQCRYRINYNLRECMDLRGYVYVRCGPRNLPSEYDYWGNIRVSIPHYELSQFSSGFNDLRYVDVYGAGFLHEDKVAAIQSIYRVANSDAVRVHHCTGSGYDYIAPRSPFSVLHGAIENNNGYAIGALVLNGDSSEQPESQFVPLDVNTAPYNVYGLLRMCTAEKLVYVRDRALLYHKYTFDTIDCVKVIRSREPHKQIAIRFLQVHVYNDSFYRNAIEMYNGEFFDARQRIGEITVNSTLHQRRYRYQTGAHYDTMGIRVTSSPAFGDYGFIAEVITLPQSPSERPEFGPGKEQRIAYTSMTKNEGGGFVFRNVGDNNPRVIFESNSILECGYPTLNMTSPALVDVFIQNSRMLTISNNYIARSAGGGILVNTTTKDNEVALYANITNNVILFNTHGEPLHLEGHQYQGFDVRYNYIANNDAEYRNIIAAFGIQLNFSMNIVFNNRAQCILNASVLEKISINQYYTRNSIYDNLAFAINQSTIFLKSSKFQFLNNYIVNPYNVYEMVTFNRTKYPDGMYPSVDARTNWWGKNSLSYVAGRIWERRDDNNLITVDYEPFIKDNSTVLSGKCFPGWRQFESKCYWYFGGVTTYANAASMCKATHGRLAWARDPKGRETNLGQLIYQFQFNADVRWMTWVYSDRLQNEKLCTALRDYKVEHTDCSRLLPFICERDPFIMTYMNWVPIIVICSIVGSILVFVVLPLMLFALIKSRQRRYERVERREQARSLHASCESLNSMRGGPRAARGSRGSLDSLDDLSHKKRRPPVDLSISTNKYNGSSAAAASDSFDMKPKYDFYRPTTPLSSADFASTQWDGDSTFDDSNLGAHGGFLPPPLCENEIANVSGSAAVHSPRYAPVAEVAPYNRRRDYDDDASVTHSLMGFSGSGGGGGGSRRPRRPAPSYSADVVLGPVDESDTVPISRQSSDVSRSTREGRQRPPRPML